MIEPKSGLLKWRRPFEPLPAIVWKGIEKIMIRISVTAKSKRLSISILTTGVINLRIKFDNRKRRDKKNGKS